MKLTEDDIEKYILACTEEFSNSIGLKRLSKVLYGKQTLKEKSKSSKYFGVLSDYSEEEITSFINRAVDKNLLTVTKYFNNDILHVTTPQNQDFKTEIKKSECQKTVISAKTDDENVLKTLKLLSEKKNIFITGHAGTGKSYILERLKEIVPDIVITSTTGIAAVNVKGQTLHSWAGIGICNLPIEETVKNINDSYTLSKRIRACKILAIDEVSMLDIKTFEYTDKVLKNIRNTDKPFGGIQVIFIGDFYQLPPSENEELKKGYCFESPLWKKFNFVPVILTKNYRQSEENLIKALSDIRINALTPEDEKLLRTRECNGDEDLSDILHIFATNEEAKQYNKSNFTKIDAQEKPFHATDLFYGKTQFDIDKYCSVEKKIELKNGARVMLLINLDFDKCLINGSCGNVLEMGEDYVLVKFDNGERYEVRKHDFEFYRNEKLIAKRTQIPLKLAYGITIHKSQGMSLDKLVVDGKKVFANGQVYVALSRIKTLNGLYLVNFDPKTIKVDEKVVEFYKNL